jgi:hypothetical protein
MWMDMDMDIGSFGYLMDKWIIKLTMSKTDHRLTGNNEWLMGKREERGRKFDLCFYTLSLIEWVRRK